MTIRNVYVLASIVLVGSSTLDFDQHSQSHYWEAVQGLKFRKTKKRIQSVNSDLSVRDRFIKHIEDVKNGYILLKKDDQLVKELPRNEQEFYFSTKNFFSRGSLKVKAVVASRNVAPFRLPEIGKEAREQLKNAFEKIEDNYKDNGMSIKEKLTHPDWKYFFSALEQLVLDGKAAWPNCVNTRGGYNAFGNFRKELRSKTKSDGNDYPRFVHTDGLRFDEKDDKFRVIMSLPFDESDDKMSMTPYEKTGILHTFDARKTYDPYYEPTPYDTNPYENKFRKAEQVQNMLRQRSRRRRAGILDDVTPKTTFSGTPQTSDPVYYPFQPTLHLNNEEIHEHAANPDRIFFSSDCTPHPEVVKALNDLERTRLELQRDAEILNNKVEESSTVASHKGGFKGRQWRSKMGLLSHLGSTLTRPPRPRN